MKKIYIRRRRIVATIILATITTIAASNIFNKISSKAEMYTNVQVQNLSVDETLSEGTIWNKEYNYSSNMEQVEIDNSNDSFNLYLEFDTSFKESALIFDDEIGIKI